MNAAITLNDKYEATEGRVLITGTQALVRLPMVQMRRDKATGLNTAALVSGYRGSPLGGYDQQLMAAKPFLDRHDVTFQPGLNEDLAATAIWGTQQVGLSSGATKDGVVGLWYGKGPGVDRSGDAFKHANAAGSAKHGGVLAIAGDDHTCKSSTVPHQSDHAFIAALMPVLYPSSVHEFIELGLIGIAMSRYSGCWVGYKVITETVETTSVVDLASETRSFQIPTDFAMPEDGLNLRWPDPPLVQDERLQELKGYAAIAFARANGVNLTTMDCPGARMGIVASGKAYEDVAQALEELGIGTAEAAAIGLRLYKVRMPWPLEPEGIRHFSEGLEEVLIVEERREIIENQIKQQLFNWRTDVRPRIVGKVDEQDRPFLSHSSGLTVAAIAHAIAARLHKLGIPEAVQTTITANLQRIDHARQVDAGRVADVTRQPHFCAGCPHNTSTQVPEGSKAMVGIGCHFMVQWMDRNSETFTHMGAEGVPWTAIGRYTTEKHRFVNLGDGTYFHSGLLAIRQAVAANASITYKVLYNDAVAMTGGQAVDGELTPPQITHQLFHERVRRIYLVSDHPEAYPPSDLAPGVIVRHRDQLDTVMRTLREIEGVTAIVYVQTCAAELRRRRKRGKAPDPQVRTVINPAVCEGCGDCSVQSNCIAIEPVETELGRKRTINQSTCNKDLSCLKGFCPSFVTVHGGALKQQAALAEPDASSLPQPALPSLENPWNILVTGVGGTGVLTIGALLAMAAHVDGKATLVMDMAGLAQKGGAVMSHIRIGHPDAVLRSPKIVDGGTDLLLAADAVVAASKDSTPLCDPDRTTTVCNTRTAPVSNFVRERDFDFGNARIQQIIAQHSRSDEHFRDFTTIALAVAGDEIAVNMVMLGYAWQKGLIPLSLEALEQAIALNGVAVTANRRALAWGRLYAHDPDTVRTQTGSGPARQTMDSMSLDDLIAHRRTHLTSYQNAALADRYGQFVATVQDAVKGLPNAEALTRAVAHNYAKVLAYKDEYEVARLFTDPSFRASLAQQFAGGFKLRHHLAPPLLPGKDASGRPRKRAFGRSVVLLFPLLARMKRLRGTPLDLFGYTAERRAERALITAYEQDVATVLAAINADNISTALDLLSLPDHVRGFGPVKEAAMATFHKRRADLRARLNRTNHSDGIAA